MSETLKVCRKLSFEEIDVDINNMPSNIPGVWMLVGKKTESDKWKCIQVGANANIYHEIAVDIEYMNRLVEMPNKDYINQFGELCDELSISSYPSEQNQLYKAIRDIYEELAFIVVCENIEEKAKRNRIEKYVAYRTRARFWRNGGPYPEPKIVKNEELVFDGSFVQEYLPEIDNFLDSNIVTDGMKAFRS